MDPGDERRDDSKEFETAVEAPLLNDPPLLRRDLLPELPGPDRWARKTEVLAQRVAGTSGMTCLTKSP
jgi:hypothetical protein